MLRLEDVKHRRLNMSREHDDDCSPTTVADCPVHVSSGSSPTTVRGHRRYVSLAILFFVNLINYMDRYTVSAVLKDVKHEYDLNDSEGGLLQTVFVVSYMITAPAFGYLGDRYSRRIVMTGGVACWSATTLLCSWPPTDRSVFFLLRALVGVGEASYSTVAPTVIADLFTGKERSRMLAIFYFAIPVGSGLGYAVGAGISSATGEWYWALRVTPILGTVAVVLLLFVLEDPPRGANEGLAGLGPTSLRADLKFLAKNRSYCWSTLGFTCVTFATGALSWWAPSYMTDAYNVLHDLPADDKRFESMCGSVFGGVTMAAGLLGVSLGSWLSTHFRQTRQDADALISAAGMLISVPLLFVGSVYAHKTPKISWVMFFLGITSICVNWSIVADILLYTVIPTRRATAAAFQILCSHLFGDAASPYVVGQLSDAISRGSTDRNTKYFALQYALYFPVALLVLGALFFVILSWYLEEDRRRCERHAEGFASHGHAHDDRSVHDEDEDAVRWDDDRAQLVLDT